MNVHAPPSRRLIVMGSTGSVGVNTLKVVEHLNATTEDPQTRIHTVGLAARQNVKRLIEQAHQFKGAAVAISDPEHQHTVEKALPGIPVYAGPNAALELVEATQATDVAAAIVGVAGLPPVLAAIKKGLTIGLANKETLVAAGPLVTTMVHEHGAKLIPVDSEHSAIFQCLRDRERRPGVETVKRIVLTASGGPFRTVDKASMDHATVEQALKHPTWSMGPKITIDSATMMNKALEIIEAHWLFNLPPSKIDVIVHPQSIVHSFVEFADNSILAQLGPPDMRTPIQYALTCPNRQGSCSQALDWSTLSTLEFEQPDYDKFPALRLAYEVIKAGGTAGAIFNAANESAVAAFLASKIRFGRILELIAEALDQIQPQPAECLNTILEADHQAREFVNDRIAS